MLKIPYIIVSISLIFTMAALFFYINVKKTEQLPDFSKISNIKERKTAFISYIVPYINAEISKLNRDRSNLLNLYNEYIDGKNLSKKETLWFVKLTHKYRMKNNDINNLMTWTELKKRLDILPTSMIIAQAALETAWGTSRFAKEGNNLFGQQCYTKNCGIMPLKREAGKTHEVMKFKNIGKSIEAYLLNLNGHKAYEMLRTTRRTNRIKNQYIGDDELHKRLGKYSEIGNNYNIIIEKIISQNNLQKYDKKFD